MSNSYISTQCEQKPPELPEVKDFHCEKTVSLKNRRKSTYSVNSFSYFANIQIVYWKNN